MSRVMMLAAAAACAGLLSVQAQDTAENDRAAVRQAVLDYAEGYYDHAPDRMERAISPLLTKRGLNLRPGIGVLQMNAEMLVDATRGTAPRPAAAGRKMTAEALDVQREIASARVFSVLFNDYAHLVKRNGRWQLVSVLWHAPPASSTAAPPASDVESVVRDFGAALAGKDAPRALALLHPLAAFRLLTAGTDGGRVLRDLNPETLAASFSNGPPFLPAQPGDVHTAVLGIDGDLASAKLSAGTFTMYLHVGLTNGHWQIVNTLGNRASAP